MSSTRIFRFLLVFALISTLSLSRNQAPARAASCAINPNCIYDLQTDEGDNALVYGETVKFVSCFSGPGRTRLEVKENSKWKLAAYSYVKVSIPKCGKKFKYRHVYVWQVDVLPPSSSEKLQLRMVSGKWKQTWVQPIYESDQAILDGALILANCFSQVIKGLDC